MLEVKPNVQVMNMHTIYNMLYLSAFNMGTGQTMIVILSETEHYNITINGHRYANNCTDHFG